MTREEIEQALDTLSEGAAPRVAKHTAVAMLNVHMAQVQEKIDGLRRSNKRLAEAMEKASKGESWRS